MHTRPNKTSKPEYDTVITDGIITFRNLNTTLGFVRFKDTGAVEYIFVQPMYRKQGLATRLLEQVKIITGKEITPELPISPLGKILFRKNHND
jgi:GNAT superfamily N-acetyltransferase